MKTGFCRSNKGSTLALVMVVLFVLTMLGTVILSLSLTNIKLRISDRDGKAAFYAAEAGLEEAYAITAGTVDEAVKSANQDAAAAFDAFISNERDMEKNNPGYHSAYLTQSDSDLDGDGLVDMPKGSVDPSKVKPKMQELFSQAYKIILNGSVPGRDPDIITRLKSADSYYSGLGSIQTGTSGYTITQYRRFGEVSEDKFPITFRASSSKSGVQKTLEITFTLKVPEYDAPYYISSEVLNLRKNVLWTKALTAGKDIHVEGNLTVNGDIYAYGSDTALANKASTYGGIKVGNNNVPGNLTVNGSTFTGGDIQAAGKNSGINVNGNIFCDSLTVKDFISESDNFENCAITVHGDVNTHDDIELNGDNSTITVDGSYYGFSYGAEGHDTSSSILINCNDISGKTDPGSGITSRSAITITGQGAGKPYYESENKGVFIGGTVYININNDPLYANYAPFKQGETPQPYEILNPYQTGESVSVKGNYRAYMEKIDDPSSPFYKDKVDFYYIPPLILAGKLKISDHKFTSDQLAEYFSTAYGQLAGEYNYDYEKLGSMIDLGKGNIDIRNVRYSTGAYITKASEGKGQISVNSPYSATMASNFQENLKEYKYYINRMGDPQSRYTDSNVSSRLDIGSRFDFGKSQYPNVALRNGNEISFSNANASKSLLIKGRNADTGHSSYPSSPGYTIDLGGTPAVKGIIVTRGDVYISGEVNYTGIIVTDGSIYVLDSQPKTITNDYDESSLPATGGNYVVKKVYGDIKSGSGVGTLFSQDPSTGSSMLTALLSSRIGSVEDGSTDGIIKSYKKYTNMISISSWKKVGG